MDLLPSDQKVAQSSEAPSAAAARHLMRHLAPLEAAATLNGSRTDAFDRVGRNRRIRPTHRDL
jgi:hypothetical protein